MSSRLLRTFPDIMIMHAPKLNFLTAKKPDWVWNIVGGLWIPGLFQRRRRAHCCSTHDRPGIFMHWRCVLSINAVLRKKQSSTKLGKLLFTWNRFNTKAVEAEAVMFFWLGSIPARPSSWLVCGAPLRWCSENRQLPLRGCAQIVCLRLNLPCPYRDIVNQEPHSIHTLFHSKKLLSASTAFVLNSNLLCFSQRVWLEYSRRTCRR